MCPKFRPETLKVRQHLGAESVTRRIVLTGCVWRRRPPDVEGSSREQSTRDRPPA
jgi:hypothetical protein